MYPVSVHTPATHDVIEDSLGVHNVIIARGEGARVVIIAAVASQGGAGFITRVVRVKARITGYPKWALWSENSNVT